MNTDVAVRGIAAMAGEVEGMRLPHCLILLVWFYSVPSKDVLFNWPHFLFLIFMIDLGLWFVFWIWNFVDFFFSTWCNWFWNLWSCVVHVCLFVSFKFVCFKWCGGSKIYGSSIVGVSCYAIYIDFSCRFLSCGIVSLNESSWDYLCGVQPLW